MSLQTINFCNHCWAGTCTNESAEKPSSASEIGGIRYCDDPGQGTERRITCDKADVATEKISTQRSQASKLQMGLSEIHDGDGVI